MTSPQPIFRLMEKSRMKSAITPWLLVWAALLGIVSGTQAARAEPFVYVPLGSDGHIAIVAVANHAVVGKIDAVPYVHGLAGTPDGRYLIAGSFEERESGSGAPAKLAGVSED